MFKGYLYQKTTFVPNKLLIFIIKYNSKVVFWEITILEYFWCIYDVFLKSIKLLEMAVFAKTLSGNANSVCAGRN